MHNFNETDPTLVDNGLPDEISLRENVVSKYKQVLQDRIPNRGYDSIQVKLQSSFALLEIPITEQTEIIQKSVSNCHRAAAILPVMEARDMYKELVKEEKLVYAFIGEESFSNIDWLFYFYGIIPPNLIKRMHRIRESGVWQWWVDMFAQKHLMNENTDIVKAANLAGNIVIVFVVWGVGMGLAFLSAYLEFMYALILGNIGLELIRVYFGKMRREYGLLWALTTGHA